MHACSARMDDLMEARFPPAKYEAQIIYKDKRRDMLCFTAETEIEAISHFVGQVTYEPLAVATVVVNPALHDVLKAREIDVVTPYGMELVVEDFGE